ncbi:MAG: ammonia-forming cytochrome c nitrite reductase subunit c552 [Desulfovibrionaceae bacterium]|nr:ammonia-forming cytochrome c nitrite reductase subunit c552 [Desulfovibrionaceae bacterium]
MSKKIFCLAVLAVFGTALFLGACSKAEKPLAPVYKTGLSKTETRNSAFGKVFPQEYASYKRNNESELMTEFKGSVPFRKHDNVNPLPKGFKNVQPYLKNLWLGYPFSWEYNEARGHTYAIHDILEIDRINQYGEAAGLPNTCWNCKTTTIPEWVAKFGDDKFWSMNFNTFRSNVMIDEGEGKFKSNATVDMDDHTIGCANCHNPETMDLIISSFPLDEALKRQGKDWRQMSRNEMRSLVCAQCHVEYYFQEGSRGINRKPVFPWDNGMDPDQMYEYYSSTSIGNKDTSAHVKGFEGKFFDWVHPVSKTPMIKVQHPEYETWYDGPHGAAGVSCADCHMPYQRADGKKKISSHQWTSPLKTPQMIDNACRQCHSDKTAEYLKGRVEYTQKKSFGNLLAAQDMSVKAHEAIRQAAAWTGYRHPNYDQLLIQAREMNRKGQFYWDFLSAENSVGFHNPAKALDTAQKSLEYSQMAINYAMQATSYGIAPDLEGDIKKIVPPIMEWSRAMQMDQAEMDKHVWTTYVAKQPKAERMWHLQKKLR